MNTDKVKKLVAKEAIKQGIPREIALSVAEQESGFDQEAKSSAGAQGVMQLMAGTAKELGVDRTNVAENIEGGVKYLKQQYERFGNWKEGLAAYNAGPGKVNEAGGVPNISETQNYIKSISESVSNIEISEQSGSSGEASKIAKENNKKFKTQVGKLTEQITRMGEKLEEIEVNSDAS